MNTYLEKQICHDSVILVIN